MNRPLHDYERALKVEWEQTASDAHANALRWFAWIAYAFAILLMTDSLDLSPLLSPPIGWALGHALIASQKRQSVRRYLR